MVVAASDQLITVIIPTYNCDRYIVKAIESVLMQEDCNYEVIVIDDGSTDSTQKGLEPYQNRIRYLKQENQGVAAARNQGIAQAKGNLVAFLDADDYFFPGKLAKQAAIFAQKPEIAIVHSGWQRVDSRGNKLLDIRPWEKIPELDLASWLHWNPALTSAMMFRREWLEYVGGFDSRFPPAEDTDLVLRMALKGCKAAWLREVTVYYRQDEQKVMDKGLPQAHSLTAVIDNFFAQPDLPATVRLIEYKVRYRTLVWIAWYLHYTRHPVEMVEYLKKSWQYRPYSPIKTTIQWVEYFAEYASNWGLDFDAYDLTSSSEWQELTKWIMAEMDEMK